MASYDLIQKLMDTGKSGAVTFTLPKPDGKGYQTPITGCLIGDISIKLSNKFQAVLPNIDALTLASQIITNDQNALAWTASTQSAWMGSEPLRLSIPFYLFSFNESDNIKSKISMFRQLLAPYQVSGSSFTIKVHGGYNPDVFEGSWNDASVPAGTLSNGNNDIVNNLKTSNAMGYNQGLIKIQIGSQITLDKMLIEDLVTENSQIQVADGNPLYIKATATFKSYRVLFSHELNF